MLGGEIDKNALIESFTRIKNDIMNLKTEIESLKKENSDLKEKITIYENLLNNKDLKNQLNEINNKEEIKDFNLLTNKSYNDLKSNKEFNSDLIKIIVKEAVETAIKKQKKPNFIEKINKNRKNIIINRLLNLAEQKNLSTSEIKEIIVDQENLCSKATFYRYIEKLKKKQLIDFIKIDEKEIVVRLR